MEIHPKFTGWKNIIKNSHNPKWSTDLYTITIKIPIDFFTEREKKNPEIHREPISPQIAKAISGK